MKAEHLMEPTMRQYPEWDLMVKLIYESSQIPMLNSHHSIYNLALGIRCSALWKANDSRGSSYSRWSIPVSQSRCTSAHQHPHWTNTLSESSSQTTSWLSLWRLQVCALGLACCPSSKIRVYVHTSINWIGLPSSLLHERWQTLNFPG